VPAEDAEGHTGYFAPGTRSLRTFAAIARGAYGRTAYDRPAPAPAPGTATAAATGYPPSSSARPTMMPPGPRR
ncbi:hypothetical protein MHW47_14930, partial [Streptomyces sp. OfavH-34-F]|nr:hypothetical protein [Streptomyces sp. OfavH-34-F]